MEGCAHKSATILVLESGFWRTQELKVVNKKASIEQDPCPSPSPLPSQRKDEILACGIHWMRCPPMDHYKCIFPVDPGDCFGRYSTLLRTAACSLEIAQAARVRSLETPSAFICT